MKKIKKGKPMFSFAEELLLNIALKLSWPNVWEKGHNKSFLVFILIAFFSV